MYIAPYPASGSQALSMTNIQENKLYQIKNRYKQMCLKTDLTDVKGGTLMTSQKKIFENKNPINNKNPFMYK